MLILRIPLREVAAVAEQAGVAAADLRFDGAGAVSPHMAGHWRRVVAHAHRELSGPDSALAQPLVAAHMTQMHSASLLATFPNTTMRLDVYAVLVRWRPPLSGAQLPSSRPMRHGRSPSST